MSVTGPLTASSIQKSMWIAERLEGQAGLYNVPLAWSVRGRLDPAALGRAIAIVIERHEILRTAFVAPDGELCQEVGAAWKPDLARADLRSLPAVERARELRAWLRSQASQPFQPETGRLIRAGLADLDEHEQVFSFCVHHLIWDAGSTSLFLADLRRYYRPVQGGPPAAGKPLRARLSRSGPVAKDLRSPTMATLAQVWSELLEFALPGQQDSFFELGGHSLLMTKLAAEVATRLGVRLALRELFEHPRLGDLAGYIDARLAESGPRPAEQTAAAGDVSLPMASIQQRIWFAERIDGSAPLYNVPIAWRIRGQLDIDALRRAIAMVVARHEILRTRFVEHGGELRQLVGQAWEPPLEQLELRGLDEEQRLAEIIARVRDATSERFDFTSGRLIRLTLLGFDPEDHAFLLRTHHLVWDGVCTPIFMADLEACYATALGDRAEPPRPQAQYRDFVRSRDHDHADGVDFWTRRLEGAPSRLPWSLPERAEQHGAVVVELPASLPQSLRDLRREYGVSPFMVLAAAVAVMLHQSTGLQDVTFGCPVADRDEETTAAVLGPCLNMIVVRSLCTPDTTLGELLRAIRGWLLDAFEYRDTPFEKVLQQLAPPRYADRAPYVDVTLNLPDSLPDAGRLGAASLSPLPFDEWDTGVKFGLTVSFTESGGAMRGVLSYHGDRFTRADTERMAGQLGQVLHRFPDLLDRPVLAMDTEGAGTPSPARQYRDVFDDEITARQRGPADLARVVGRLRGAPSALGFLPPGRPEPHGDVAVPMPDGTLGRLRSMGAADGVSWFMVVATALAQVLHRWTGSDDVAFCVPVSTRDTRSAQVIGPCLNTVVLRSVRAPGTTAQELLRSMRDAVLDAFEHRRVPFDAVVDALNPPRPPGRPPFLDVALVADVEPGFPASLGEATLTPLPPDHEGAAHVAKFGLTVSFAETGGRLTGSVLHHGDRFSRAEVTRMAGLLGRLLGRFPDILATPADALDLIGDEEREELTGFESGGPAIPAALVLDAVMLRCAEQPHAAAIVSDEGIVTYGELAVRARRLAATLRALVAGDEGDGELFVAVLLPRGCKLVIAMLAAWLAGCAFCPLEPDFPVSRIQSVLADLGARAVVTDDLTWAQRLAPVPVIAVSAAAPAAAATAAGDDGSTDDVARVDADATAYVLYTSGTTGSAKGVAYSHAALAAVIAWYVGTFSLTPADRVSQIHSTAFDMTQLELWSALTAGATLLPYQAPMILAPDLAEWVNERAVTVLCTPTSLAQALWFSGVPLRSLRWMFFAGSPLRQPPPEQLTYRVGDLYGPTETFITTAHILAPQSGAPVNCVGRPVAGDLVYVLDELGGRCPIGVPGEIHVGGIGVAKGYLGKPALTAERFADKDPDHRPGRIYRTGDRGRWLPDGRLEFLGRMDRQLKIRGYRVEPAEVEAHLLRDPLVRAAVAHQVGDDPAHLVGYLVPRTPGASDTDSVLTRLRQQLPDFMVPDAIVWLSELPMTVRGKVDPARLPHPERTDMAGPGPLVAPGNELERRIAKTWSDTLGVGRVGVSDSFFDLGGNSLLLAKLHLKLQADLGITLPIQRLLAFPTVRALAAALSAPDGATSSGGHSSSPQELRERAQRARQSSARRAAQRMGKP